jgi:hypothetical protein
MRPNVIYLINALVAITDKSKSDLYDVFYLWRTVISGDWSWLDSVQALYA